MSVSRFLNESKVITTKEYKKEESEYFEPPFLGPFTLHGTLLLMLSMLIPFGTYYLIVGSKELASEYILIPLAAFITLFVVGAIVMHHIGNKAKKEDNG